MENAQCPTPNDHWALGIGPSTFSGVLTVLVVRFSSIGDILLTTPLVRALRRRHPDAELVYVTKRALAPLVADNPHVSRVVSLEPGEPIHHLAERLRPLQPTHGLDLHGSLRALALRALVRCRWSGYRKRKVGFRPVAVGGPDDRGAAQQLAGVAAPAAGAFTLQETGALLAHTRVVVSGDTGVMHMATAVRTPVVALFGPTVEQFGFFPYHGRAAVVEHRLRCRPCSAMGSSRCPLGHHRCLRDILP